MPLNPPKIHFFGNNAICAKWLPWAQQEINKLTRYQGNYFHKKYMMNGGEVIIWLDNDGFNRRIYIQGGRGKGYEFYTAHYSARVRHYPEYQGVPDSTYGVFNQTLNTTCRLSGGSIVPRNSKFRKLNFPEAEAFNKTPFLLTGGVDYVVEEADYFDDLWPFNHRVWYEIPAPDDEAAVAQRQADGVEPDGLSYHYSERRYGSRDFFATNFDVFAEVNFYRGRMPGWAASLKPGSRKPKPWALSVSHVVDDSDRNASQVAFGNSGRAGAKQGGFYLLSSITGYDYKFTS